MKYIEHIKHFHCSQELTEAAYSRRPGADLSNSTITPTQNEHQCQKDLLYYLPQGSGAGNHCGQDNCRERTFGGTKQSRCVTSEVSSDLGTSTEILTVTHGGESEVPSTSTLLPRT